MAQAYTPGLTVTGHTTIRKLRRLPLAGEVLVHAGQYVEPDDILARAELPGIMRTCRTAELLGLDPKDLPSALLVKEGDTVCKGQTLARTSSFFGLFKNESRAPVAGLVELINPLSGNIGIREAPSPVEIRAYVRGKVLDVLPSEGAVVETRGALIQGIFGIGGEQNGTIRMLSANAEIPEDCQGAVLVTTGRLTLEQMHKAAECGAVGVVAGGVIDADLVQYLGHDIGVAITGSEPVPATIIVTEGFGEIQMADRTRALLQSLEGRPASINGATQIRAGVIRPEIIVPGEAAAQSEAIRQPGALEIGSPIRIIREPHFGALATVTELPPELETVPSGAQVRVLVAMLEGGVTVRTPRANVELVEQ